MTEGSTIPAHLVLGSLGSGKTTAIQALLKTKSPDETWVVFVNEFGRVSIDTGLLEESTVGQSNILVHESAGGCICCSGAMDLDTGMQEIVSTHRPDRIIIEPTGLSDPRSLKDQIVQFSRNWGVQLVSTIGVLDIRITGHQRFKEMPYFEMLVNCSDYILGSKADRATSDVIDRFKERVIKLMPHPDNLFIDRGNLCMSDWQTYQSTFPVQFFDERMQIIEESHRTDLIHSPEIHADILIDKSKNHTAIGWKFEINVCFEKAALTKFLLNLNKKVPSIVRLKGILATETGWFSIQSVGHEEPVWKKTQPMDRTRLLCIVEGTDITCLQSPAFSRQLKATQVSRK